MKTPQVKIKNIGCALCMLSALGLVVCIAFMALDGRYAHGDEMNLTFIRSEVFFAPFLLAIVSTALLLPLLFCCLVKRDKQAGALAYLLALSVSFYAVAIVPVTLVGFSKTSTWEVKEHLKGRDHHTYYLLHAPPPLAGDGKGALARRTGGNQLYYTMHIVLVDYYGNEDTVLHTGLESADPRIRRTCRMLLETTKRRSAARQHALN